jgi:hypothetical protein
MADIVSRESILRASRRRTAEVEVPELGGVVRLMALSATEVLEYHRVIKSEGADHVAWLLVRSIVDADGKRIFTDEDGPQISSAWSVKIFTSALKLNVLTVEAAAEQQGN